MGMSDYVLSIEAQQDDAKQIAALEAQLKECLDYFVDRSDVVDGDYGEPAPNKEMRLATEIRETLGMWP